MHRLHFYLALIISIATLPLSALAETAAAPATADWQIHNQVPAAAHGNFYIDLPTVNANQLIGLIRDYRASLTQREQEMMRYLEENRLDTKDVLISIILPGGLLYAAVRKGKREQTKAELAEMSEDLDELSRDLLAMQAVAGELTVARLQ
jgi:hypothetical protein